MLFDMYGIGCAYCGRAADAWLDDRLWPCGCPAPAHRRSTAEPARPLALADRRPRPAVAERGYPTTTAVPA